MSRRNNSLTSKQTYAVCNFVKDNFQTLKGMTLQQISDKATDELGFKVTIFNMQSVKQITELDIGHPYTPQNLNQRQAIRIISYQLVRLMDSLGYDIPDELSAIAKAEK